MIRRFLLTIAAFVPQALCAELPAGNVVPPAPQPPVTVVSYRLRGNAAIRPVQVREDGDKTYIEWAPQQALPATFALNAKGEEETVDSYMRGGLQVIDRVYDTLVFRMGKIRARAQRPTGPRETGGRPDGAD